MKVVGALAATPWMVGAVLAGLLGSAPLPVVAQATPLGAPKAVLSANGELAVELAYWEAIRSSRDAADYDAYLSQFPEGRFVLLARSRRDRYSVPPQAATPVPVMTALVTAGTGTETVRRVMPEPASAPEGAARLRPLEGRRYFGVSTNYSIEFEVVGGRGLVRNLQLNRADAQATLSCGPSGDSFSIDAQLNVSAACSVAQGRLPQWLSYAPRGIRGQLPVLVVDATGALGSEPIRILDVAARPAWALMKGAGSLTTEQFADLSPVAAQEVSPLVMPGVDSPDRPESLAQLKGRRFFGSSQDYEIEFDVQGDRAQVRRFVFRRAGGYIRYQCGVLSDAFSINAGLVVTGTCHYMGGTLLQAPDSVKASRLLVGRFPDLGVKGSMTDRPQPLRVISAAERERYDTLKSERPWLTTAQFVGDLSSR
jgi:hypothetical protein